MKECKVCHINFCDEDIIKYNNICPCCHSKNSFIEEYIMDIKRISDNEDFIDAMIKLHDENPIEYQLKLNQFKLQQEQVESIKEQQRESSGNKAHCPKCGCTDIQVVPRKWSLLTGFMTNKTDRVCVKCKHKF